MRRAENGWTGKELGQWQVRTSPGFSFSTLGLSNILQRPLLCPKWVQGSGSLVNSVQADPQRVTWWSPQYVQTWGLAVPLRQCEHFPKGSQHLGVSR